MEMANSYIKMLLLPTRGICNCLQNRVGFFFLGGGGHEQGARETPDGKGARKITPFCRLLIGSRRSWLALLARFVLAFARQKQNRKQKKACF